ncbi:alcohol dehydrogenase catalytic domain-containing protein [Rugamonas apoptosis]|uniref:Alcohol dehydrogenase catalytic domain-containing protein n=1 Tax=Rugamonas apoptosis TaxID=2758570 RepID=A0A7W2FDW0_9BURK|nr:alcohol dehydrogenase catalytic domain-containing protein [Rugamonas apoptosis]MBA5689908.1 alcohol dehydrogenase catalytic domain-containing protein [Rugamonas apoptosis]
MTGTTLAATIDDFGDAGRLQLRVLPLARPGRGQIMVRVEAASVNPIDVRRRSGYGRRLMSLLGAARLPLVLGNDFAGTVCAVGPGVTQWREGDAVYGVKPPSSQGTHATHVVVAAQHALRRPPGMAAIQVATLPYNFLTVWRALAGAGITHDAAAGRRVLVHGASGGLGLIALRLLQSMDAHVTAIAGGAQLAACQRAGAQETLDRHAAPLAALPADFAATLNFASWDDEAALLRLLTARALGHASTVHPMLGLVDRHGLAGGLARAWYQRRRMAAHLPHGARYDWTVFRPAADALRALADFAPLLPLHGAIVTYPLTQAAQAHRHVELREPGRVVLLPQLT